MLGKRLRSHGLEPIPPLKKRWYENIGTLHQLTYTMACVTHFALKHHNAEEHIRTYINDVCENDEQGEYSAFLKWLAWLHEVD